MGEVREQITLMNGGDVISAGRGYLPEQEVRQMTAEVLVDTGSMRLVMDDETCKRLGLGIVKKSMATLAGGVRQTCKRDSPSAESGADPRPRPQSRRVLRCHHR